jgi:flagellar assembly protein FliH
MTDKHGRLVKKENVDVVGYLDIQEYPWLDFREEALLQTDNPRKSVVHSRFHTEAELQRKIRIPAHFQRPMGPRTRTLAPVDLTDEFQRSQQEIFLRKRKRMLDEDELFNLELADLNNQEELDGIWTKRGAPGHDERVAAFQANAAAAPGAERASAVPRAGTAASASPPLAAAVRPVSGERSPAGERPVVAESPAAGASPELPAQALSSASAASNSAGAMKTADTQETERFDAQKEGLSEGHAEGVAVGHSEGFAAGRAEGLESGHAEGHAEGHAAGQAEGVALGREQGQALGYADGFADGEAKGIAVAEARTERYFSLLSAAAAELEVLRAEVLRAGQDIFVEIANLACERILRQKLGANDEALRKVLLAAVEMYGEAHRVTLEMHPDDAVRMRKALEAESAARKASGAMAPQIVVRENADLTPGDFKADSEKEIVTVDLKRAIEGLIENLRGELFPEEVGGLDASAPKTAPGRKAV